MAPLRAPRTVSEPVRERETFKYESSLLSHVTFNDTKRPLPSADLATSADSVLTALAQLAALQTGTDRALISLFDQTHQYIIAEATTSLPLVPSLGQSGHDQTLWQCGTAIPREHGVCEYALIARDIGQFDEPSDPNELPMLVVDDLTAVLPYSTKPYCQPGSEARFYAGVPIRTRRGINIGVLNVFRTVPAAEWTEQQSTIMRNLSRTIMDHLEATRLKSTQRRSDRMNRALGCFIEGRSTLSSWELGPAGAAFMDDHNEEGALNANQQSLQHSQDMANHRDDKSSVLIEGHPSLSTVQESGTEVPAQETEPDPTPTNGNIPRARDAQLVEEPESIDPNSVQGVFSKAANLIRESLEVEGCIFMDPGHSFSSGTTVPARQETETTVKAGQPLSSSSSGSSDDDKMASSASKAWTPCRVLGFSTSDRSSIDGAHHSVTHGSLAQKLLAKLLKRYPSGHLFNFNANGELQSSESSSEDDQQPNARNARGKSDNGVGDDISDTNNVPKRRQMKPWARKNEGQAILEVFPGARSVAFVPVWDPKKERWCAAGFTYTLEPTRMFTTQGELNHMKAFAMLVVGETLRLETTRADKAKSDALGSVSHELRSPLHGIVLGLELLNDTNLDVLQGNIAHTIETCCRTLTDTVDHLLDYSKINKFMTRKRKERKDSQARGQGSGPGRSIETGMRDLYKHTHLDTLIEEVVESVFAGFNFQHLSIAQLSKHKHQGRSDRDVAAIHRLDSMKAMEDLGPALTQNGQIKLSFGQISVFLVIDPACSWVFHTEPGAIRRIIMNIFGNALKYTKQGTIKVSLDQSSPKDSRSKDRIVNITVTDTGKGISETYLQSELYTPFSQEDHLSPGTGLGLSFVKQITAQLKGQITVKSKVGSGTTVRVSLPLSPVEPLPSDTSGFAEGELEFTTQARELSGLRVRVEGFDKSYDTDGNVSDVSVGGNLLVQHVCREWLHMQVMTDQEDNGLVPDLIIRSEDTLSQSPGSTLLAAKIPCVVVCANALSAYQHTASLKDHPGTFEFTPQPIGPRKLAKTLSLVFNRWTEAQANAMSPVSQASEDTKDHFQPLIWSEPLPTRVVTPREPASRTSYFEEPMFLVVDDNTINLKILASYMKKLKWPYQTATNGQEALDAYVANPGQYKCVLMDISMPIMDGFEATRRIRAFEHENKLQPALVLALSGLASESAQAEAFESGLDLFLSKPVMLKELSAILDKHGLLKGN